MTSKAHDEMIAGVLANLRSQFPHVCFLYNPFDGCWYALYSSGGFMVAHGPLELRERLGGIVRGQKSSLA
jgi:hypothetical protein